MKFFGVEIIILKETLIQLMIITKIIGFNNTKQLKTTVKQGMLTLANY